MIARWAMRPEDRHRALLDHEPQIVHFSSHGAGERGLVLENDADRMQPGNRAGPGSPVHQL